MKMFEKFMLFYFLELSVMKKLPSLSEVKINVMIIAEHKTISCLAMLFQKCIVNNPWKLQATLLSSIVQKQVSRDCPLSFFDDFQVASSDTVSQFSK